MSAEGPKSGWAEPVAAFLTRFTPRDDDGSWNHEFSSAWQLACEVLVALGHADATETGAKPKPILVLPAAWPRWDDISVTVLAVAERIGLIDYLPHGSNTTAYVGDALGFGPALVPPSSMTLLAKLGRLESNPLPKAPSISPAFGLGPAQVSPSFMLLLAELGLVENAAWSDAAELVLWRDPPPVWKLAITSDVRFQDAVNVAMATMPNEVEVEIDHLTTVNAEDVEQARAASLAWHREAREKHGARAQVGEPFTLEQARQSVIHGRRNKLDWLFFRQWRLSDGWLTTSDMQRGLLIFHDPLAISMRQAIVKQRHPDRREMHVRF